MGDPMAPSEGEGNSEGGGVEQAGRLWNERKGPSPVLVRQYRVNPKAFAHG